MSVTDNQPTQPAARHRSTRDRPAKPPLSEQAIVAAALELLQSEGLDAVSMRRVAAMLDTGAASLYVYFAGREALLFAMLDRVTASIELEPPKRSRWRAQLHSLMQRVRDALAAHPGISTLTFNGPFTSDAVLLLIENMLGILLAGGVDPQGATWACDILMSLVTAVVNEQDIHNELRRTDDDMRARIDELHTTFAGLPPEQFPLITAHADQMVAGDGDQRFHFGIDLVIDGLIKRSSR